MLTIHRAPVVLPIASEPVEDGAVVVDGDRIVAMGPWREVAVSEARVRAWPGVLAPGLVNAHTHLQYTDFADLATSGLPFFPWIRSLMERRRTFDAEGWRASTRRGVHEALRTGTTCVADVVSEPAVLPVLARSGLAGTAYVEVVGVDSDRWPGARARLVAALDAAPSGIEAGVSPHTLYTLGAEAVRGAASVARERGLRLHPHLAETAHESEYVLCGTGTFAEFGRSMGFAFELLDGGSGRSPVAYAAGLGLLGPDVHVAHGVHVDADDRATLRSSGTAVALCARSNALLAAGEAPVAEYLAEGNAVAVGTDSRASSPSLDVRDELRSYTSVPARTLVEMATIGGANALGRGDVGRLAPGARADLAAFDVGDGDPYEALLGPGPCVGTVLGGRIVHRAAP